MKEIENLDKKNNNQCKPFDIERVPFGGRWETQGFGFLFLFQFFFIFFYFLFFIFLLLLTLLELPYDFDHFLVVLCVSLSLLIFFYYVLCMIFSLLYKLHNIMFYIVFVPCISSWEHLASTSHSLLVLHVSLTAFASFVFLFIPS